MLLAGSSLLVALDGLLDGTDMVPAHQVTGRRPIDGDLSYAAARLIMGGSGQSEGPATGLAHDVGTTHYFRYLSSRDHSFRMVNQSFPSAAIP